MAESFSYSRRIEFRDTDAAGIVHFSVYFNYMEEAEHALLRHLGIDVFMQDDRGEISFPRVAASCDYHSPLRFGDTVTIDVKVVRLGDSSVTYGFGFEREDEKIATGTSTVVCCRMPDQGGKPQAVSVPRHVADKLATLVQ
jgi:4-hydroxybenzoyl-CoA thioesterase/acyl-CoA thioester hydrolase